MFISVRKDPNMSMPATKIPFSINLGFMAFTISKSLLFAQFVLSSYGSRAGIDPAENAEFGVGVETDEKLKQP